MKIIDPKTDADEEFLLRAGDGIGGKETGGILLRRAQSGFVAAHETVGSGIDEEQGIGLEGVGQPLISAEDRFGAGSFNGINRRVAELFIEESGQMDFGKIFARAVGSRGDAKKRGSGI